jgi:hypothetical protein
MAQYLLYVGHIIAHSIIKKLRGNIRKCTTLFQS